jgi:pyrroloquinoline quinone (PQQ) biosynthesis protein C
MAASFGDLVMRTDEARRDFETHPAVMDAVASGMSVERYRALLLELYHVVWHFNPISAAAASRLSDDFVPVRYFLYEHMQEEAGHEVWVRNDLEAIGVAPDTTRAHAPGVHTLALNGYNYWCADRRHPCSVLGMLYALEVIASVYGGPFASAIQESLLLDGDRGISFIGSHATLDAQHMAELRQVIDTVEDTAARDAIVESANFNFFQFKHVIAAV